MDALQQMTDPSSLGEWFGALNSAIVVVTFVVAILICLCGLTERHPFGGED